MKKIALLLLSVVVLFAACEKNPDTEQTGQSLTLNPNKVEIKIGEEKKIRATVTPATDSYTLKWTSSNEAVATVDSKGNVIGLAAGNATITATIVGTTVSATAEVTVLAPFDALKFYTMAPVTMSEQPYQIPSIDENEDGTPDDIYEVMFYVLPESIYLSGNSFVGDNDYLLVLNTSFAVVPHPENPEKMIAYSLGGYSISDDPEEYSVEIDGKSYLKPHWAKATNFNSKIYLDYYTLLMQNQGEAADAYIDENGWYLDTEKESYFLFIDFESGYPSDAGLVLSGELENGRVAASYDLDYYSIQAKMFGGDVFRTGGLATEMVEDPETGEMKETFVWPLEMAEMVDKTFSYGEPLPEEEPAQVKAQQANFGAVPFEAVKKQISVNNALFTSLRLAKKL